MIPIRHTLAPRTTPIVNRALVIANGIVFLTQIFLGERTENVINLFGFIPARLTNPAAYGYSMFEVIVTLVTSLFLHGGFVHLIGNMIYLWVFGGAVEDALGHVALRDLLRRLRRDRQPDAHAAFSAFDRAVDRRIGKHRRDPRRVSGAAAEGAHRHVAAAGRLLGDDRDCARVIFLPIWFAMQFFNGFLSIAAAHRTQEVAGIAWWAHVGGFIFGAAVGLIARRGKRERVTPYAAETEDV